MNESVGSCAASPLILLSNDDGVGAAGLLALREALLDVGNVVVCAPAIEQSAKSHSITLERPLRLRDHGRKIFSVDGTPVDAVYVALHHASVLQRRPDVIVSGMNHGLNLGNDIFYSGTVAAAREGALRGIPSVAFSASRGTDPAAASRYAAHIAEHVVAQCRGGVLLNVNFPPGDEWEIVATKPGRRQYGDGLEVREDPRGENYFWIGGSGGPSHVGDDDTDTSACDQGRVGITPVSLELWASAQSHHCGVIVEAVRVRARG